MILWSPGDRKYFTLVGYGLEPILPDGKVGGFGREAVPLLKAGSNDAAMLLLTRRVADVIAQDSGVTLSGQPLPAPRRAVQTGDVAYPGKRETGDVALLFFKLSVHRYLHTEST